MQGNNEKCAPLFLYVKVKTMINRMVCDSTPEETKNDIMLNMIHEVYVLVLTLNEEAAGEVKKLIISK